MLRPLALALLSTLWLAAAPASAQPADAVTGDRALALADSLLGAVLNVEREQFGTAETIALYGDGGGLYFQFGPDGNVQCEAAIQRRMLREFGEMLCISPSLFAPSGDGGGDGVDHPDFSDMSVWEADWEGVPAHAIRADGIEDADGMESMEMWIAEDPLRLVHLRAAGTFGPGMVMDVRVDRGDFRESGGVVVPHAFRFVLADPAALLAAGGVDPNEFLAEAQRQGAVKPTADTAALVAFAKAAAAGTSYDATFTVDRVEVNGPLPPDLFGGEGGPFRQPAAGGGRQ